MKNKQAAKTHLALTRLITILALVLWLVSMAMTTVLVATDFIHQLSSQPLWTVQSISSRLPFDGEALGDLPGAAEVGSLQRLGTPYWTTGAEPAAPFVLPQMPDTIRSDDWYWGKWDMLHGFKAATVFRWEGTQLTSGSYIWFPYLTGQQWQNTDTSPTGYAYISLDDIEDGSTIAENWISTLPNGLSQSFSLFCPYLRVTGWFEGNEFHPVKLDRIPNYAFLEAGYESDPSMETVIAIDNTGSHDLWETVCEYDAPKGQGLVTIYGYEPNGYCYNDPLAEDLSQNGHQLQKEGLLETILVSSAWHTDRYGDFEVLVALRLCPLGYAALRLIPLYLVSLALVVLCLFLILRTVRLRLTLPLGHLAHNTLNLDNTPPWKEPALIAKRIADAEQSAHAARTEAQQLRTALDFAQNAEASRRQLVAGITHELKTPLAVIHSYAEGLQAGIAGEKADHYLSVILEETERMDGMVLEMLDLSRLEAGKVRLSSDHFELAALTQALVQKLTPAAEGKGLTIHLSCLDRCCVIADESRMSQVITNLLTNAIKYAHTGSQIRVTLYQKDGHAHFLTENPGEHLPREKLDRLWDSFYQADASHAAKGSGLGLAIVRSIIELHRGTCQAQNTYCNEEPCVQFHISIPLG